MPGRAKRAAAVPRQTAGKVQRWIDLLGALLVHRFPVTFEQLRREVPAYADGAEGTVKRMFERDKEDLRDFGVPIESLPIQEGTNEGTGYRLRAHDFYLPFLAVLSGQSPAGLRRGTGTSKTTPLAFEPDELAAVADAAACLRRLGDPNLLGDVDSALRKLAFDLPLGALAAGAPPEERIVSPRTTVDRATFATVGRAVVDRKRLAFTYHAMSTDSTSKRSVGPYGLFFLSGHWYLAARDLDRGAMRNFRLDRIADPKASSKDAGQPDFTVPADFRLAEYAHSRQAWELGDAETVPYQWQVDGINVGNGVIRPFVPSAAWRDETEAITLLVFVAKPGLFSDSPPARPSCFIPPGRVARHPRPGPSEQEILAEELSRRVDTWGTRPVMTVHLHLVTVEWYASITGREAPPTPWTRFPWM